MCISLHVSVRVCVCEREGQCTSAVREQHVIWSVSTDTTVHVCVVGLCGQVSMALHITSSEPTLEPSLCSASADLFRRRSRDSTPELQVEALFSVFLGVCVCVCVCSVPQRFQ